VSEKPPAQRKSRGFVETKSVIPASPERVWDRATSPEGINHELGPWIRMTVPKGLQSGIPDDLAAPARLGRSWILAFGLIPVEFDDIYIAELEPGRRFHETSSMLMMSLWEHERVIERREEGCEVTDRITFEFRAPLQRVPGSYAVAGAMVAAVFRHRHRRLRSHFSRP